jgi:hypothetical protein
VLVTRDSRPLSLSICAAALSFSPITIPLEWNNYVVLLCVFFGVTKASYHRKTGDSFVVDLLSFELSRHLFENNPQRIKFQNKSWQKQLDDVAAVVTSSGMIVLIAFVPAYCFLTFMSFFIKFHTATMVPYGKWLFVFAVILGSGLFMAWRWILTTGLLFVLLVITNEVYIHGLSTPELLARLGVNLSHNLLSL